jgi:hypothetical protein
MRTARHVENQVKSDRQNLVQIHSGRNDQFWHWTPVAGACDGDVRTTKATDDDDLNVFVDAQKFISFPNYSLIDRGFVKRSIWEETIRQKVRNRGHIEIQVDNVFPARQVSIARISQIICSHSRASLGILRRIRSFCRNS